MSIYRSHSFFTVLIAVVTVLTLMLTRDLWKGIELRAYDLRLQALEYLGAVKDSYTGNIVVVGMEENVLIKEKPLIFWYPEIGKFLIKMKDYGAPVVGIDLIPIHALGEKIADAARSVFGSELDEGHNEFLEELGTQTDNSLLGPLLDVSDHLQIVQGVADENVPYYYSFMAFMRNVHAASVKLAVDNDQVIRRLELFYKDKVASFPYMVYTLQSGKGAGENTEILLNYSLTKSIPYYSFTDVMNDKLNRDKFSGKAVLLGYITAYDDVHSTPLGGKRIPGIMIHAVAAETLFSQTSFKEIPPHLGALTLICLTVIGLAISTKLRPFSAIPAILLGMTAFFITNLALFSKGHVIPLFPHILAPLLMFTFIYPYRYMVEERSKKKIYKTFSYYMDKKVIDSLIKKDAESLLKGEQQDLCILFLDIRDFTILSHQQKPENIIELLNIYFDKTTDIIQKHNGFVNKFIGDAVLAFFGTEKAVDNALYASKEIIKETKRINDEGVVTSITGNWKLRIGIGIHYGRVVMGNVGSVKKMDFTIIGDSVNIASRVEGFTKELKKTLLITETAYRMAGEKSDFQSLGKFEIRGVEDSIGLYTPNWNADTTSDSIS